jgi:hypothetical protein
MDKDEVILDGQNEIQQWPITLAQRLLDDTTSWAGGERFQDFYYLATCVTGYNRHPFGSKWGPNLLNNIKSEGIQEKHTTQELLDLMFHICRADRFNDGLIKTEEPQLRRIVQEVVQRIESSSPPTFINMEPNKRK